MDIHYNHQKAKLLGIDRKEPLGLGQQPRNLVITITCRLCRPSHFRFITYVYTLNGFLRLHRFELV